MKIKFFILFLSGYNFILYSCPERTPLIRTHSILDIPSRPEFSIQESSRPVTTNPIFSYTEYNDDTPQPPTPLQTPKEKCCLALQVSGCAVTIVVLCYKIFHPE